MNDSPFTEDRKVHENEHAFSLFDSYPVTEGHMLVVPKRRVSEVFELTDKEYQACFDLVRVVKDYLKEKYKTAFDRDMFKLIECNAVRQKWIDQSVSFNLYNNSTSLKHLNDIYMASWEAGLKTTYYLRNRAASKVEKSTTEEASACSIEAMQNGEICESCQ